METKNSCSNVTQARIVTECQTPNSEPESESVSENKPDKHIQEELEPYTKKPEDPFKMPTVPKAKLAMRKPNAGDRNSSSTAYITEESEPCLKKPEDTFKIPAMPRAKAVSKSTAGDQSTSGTTKVTEESAVAGNLTVGGDSRIPQDGPTTGDGKPSSDRCTIPDSVAPRPPAARARSSNPALPTSMPTASDKQPAVGCGPAFRPPAWSGCPPQPYLLEVLRGGQIVDTVSLESRPCVVFGRLPDCDVKLEHPSISRHHAALVYRASGDGSHEAGYYLYDLGSTHGSTLNKMAVQPKVYCRMRVGHMCKFGGSTRLFILQGPEEDREEESELTVTELKEIGEKRREQQERLERLDDQEQEPGPEPEPEPEPKPAAASTVTDGGISWGMAEDADEDTDLQFNPFALGEAENEQLYLIDPKRTLRGWFEREGHELVEYQTEELPGGRHVCRITLPLDTADGVPPVVEVQHVGKKKEAVFQCAQEACRMLDRAGVLRQAKQESRQSRRRRPAGYDSDEDDTFLDRTGAVERKRQRRQQQAASAEPKADTYQSLLAQYEKVRSEAAALESRLQQAASAGRPQSDPAADDELDAFMSRLSQGAISDRQEKRQLRGRLGQLRSEEARLCKLVNLARPAAMPPLKPPTLVAAARAPLTGFIGKRRGKAAARPAATPPEKPTVNHHRQQQHQQQRDGDDGAVRLAAAPGSNGDTGSDAAQERVVNIETRMDTDNTPPTGTGVRSGNEASEPQRVAGESEPTALKPSAGSQSVDRSGRTLVGPAPAPRCEETPQQRRREVSEGKPESTARRPDRQQAAPAVEPYASLVGDGSYDVWLPPEDQTGDGRTSLNDKLGY